MSFLENGSDSVASTADNGKVVVVVVCETTETIGSQWGNTRGCIGKCIEVLVCGVTTCLTSGLGYTYACFCKSVEVFGFQPCRRNDAQVLP